MPSCHASLLRGWNRVNKTSQIFEQNSTDTFECSLYEIEGLTPPGSIDNHQWTCELEGTGDVKSAIFDFTDDIEGIIKNNFNVDITEVEGNRMTIPWEAVRGSTINSSHEGIRISHDSSQNKRNLASLNGKHMVLIVRVKDKTGLSPKHWASHIKDDFFQDENNMVRLYIQLYIHF